MTTSFAALGVSRSLVRTLDRMGIAEPFPIQTQAIPPGLDGRDIQGKAPTGSGKTLAFGVPVLTRVGRAVPGRPRALVLAPTRELAEQISGVLTQLGKAVERRVVAVYGGVSYGPQKKVLRSGVDVLVATPGRLEDLIDQRVVALGDVDVVVVDEADRMADMGFLPVVDRILKQTARLRQTLLFSATLDGDIATLSRNHQTRPVAVEAETHGDQQSVVTHHFWRVDRNDRVAHTANIIRDQGRAIVFTRTRHGADRLAKQLKGADVSAASIHGGLSQRQRTRALESFSNGRARALIATDVAARGIHVDAVEVVVHYDPAGDPKDYLHRSGRTGRAGAAGTVVTLVSPDQERGVRAMQRSLRLHSPIGLPDSGLPVSRSKPAVPKPSGGRRHQGRDLSVGSATQAVFVGNLPWSATADDLEAMFSTHGTVERVTVAKRGGRSKGYGFVEMPSAQAVEAIRALEGAELGGRALKLKPAR
jgi:superfamily II DNA/RNA helicase